MEFQLGVIDLHAEDLESTTVARCCRRSRSRYQANELWDRWGDVLGKRFVDSSRPRLRFLAKATNTTALFVRRRWSNELARVVGLTQCTVY